MAKDKSKAPKSDKAKPQSAGLGQEQAISQFTLWLSRLPEADDVLKAAGVKRHQLFSLLADDEISQAVETRLDALLSVPYRLSPSEGVGAEFLLRQMGKFIRAILTTSFNSRLAGYSVQEAVYEKDQEISDESGYRGLKFIMEKPMEWFEPRANGELRYYPDSGTVGVDGLLVDQDYKFFLTINSPTYKQPQGKALLSKLYWPKYYRDNGWKFWGKNLERFGSPILVGKSNDTETMLHALLMAHGSAVLALDSEDEVTALGTANGNNGQAFDTFETAIIRRINKVILGQTLTSGTDGGSGSRALGDVHNNVRKDTGKQLVVGDGVRTENVKPTTNTAYKRGDLIAISSANVATHPAINSGVVGAWHAICVADMTAAQATAHVNAGLEMPIYVQGPFDIAVVTVNGTALTTNQYDAVRAQAQTNKIELRKVVGG